MCCDTQAQSPALPLGLYSLETFLSHTHTHTQRELVEVTYDKNDKEKRKVITEEAYLPISCKLPYHHTSLPARPAWLSAPVARGLPF